MNCSDLRDDLVDVLFAAADAETTARVAAHLAGCAACRAEHAALSRVVGALQRFEAPAPSPRFRARTLARVARERDAEADAALAGAGFGARFRFAASFVVHRLETSRVARVLVAVAALYLVAFTLWLLHSHRTLAEPGVPDTGTTVRAPGPRDPSNAPPSPLPFRPAPASEVERFQPREVVIESSPDAEPPEAIEPFPPEDLADWERSTEQDNAVTLMLDRFRPRFRSFREQDVQSPTDRSILNGFKWLAEHQDDDGSWDPSRFNGRESTRVGDTALIVLAFLTNAEKGIPGGEYRFCVAHALNFLRDSQDPSGTFGRQKESEDITLFNHSAATLAFVEHYVLSKRSATLYLPALTDGLARLEDMSAERTHRDGRPADRVTAPWVALALETARAAAVPGANDLTAAASGAREVLDRLMPQDADGKNAAVATTAAVEVVYTGRPSQQVAPIEGLLAPLARPNLREPTQVYFSALLAHARGGEDRRRFEDAAESTLLPGQRDDGSFHTDYWWEPVSEAGGDLYVTALTLLTLSVPHRVGP